MTPAETASYIHHHLQISGRDGDLFSDDAIAQIHEAARGKPRAVNNLALAALIATYAAGKKIADQQTPPGPTRAGSLLSRTRSPPMTAPRSS